MLNARYPLKALSLLAGLIGATTASANGCNWKRTSSGGISFFSPTKYQLNCPDTTAAATSKTVGSQSMLTSLKPGFINYGTGCGAIIRRN